MAAPMPLLAPAIEEDGAAGGGRVVGLVHAAGPFAGEGGFAGAIGFIGEFGRVGAVRVIVWARKGRERQRSYGSGQNPAEDCGKRREMRENTT
ncbi:hypothetical protein ADK76_26030 [Streptomyces griseoflavus]|nr:hypothetical protein ADK76_26030 [Streptomyces griseoflavus]